MKAVQLQNKGHAMRGLWRIHRVRPGEMESSLGGAGVSGRGAGRARGFCGGRVGVGTVLFTAHVDVTTFLANQVQGSGSKEDESQDQFPHITFSSLKKKALHRGKALNVAPEFPRVAYSVQSPA